MTTIVVNLRLYFCNVMLVQMNGSEIFIFRPVLETDQYLYCFTRLLSRLIFNFLLRLFGDINDLYYFVIQMWW